MLRRLGTVLTPAVSAAVLYFDPSVIGGVVALFVLVVPFEKLLPVWDLVFGTYFGPRNDRPDVYGVDEEVPNTVVGQLLHPLRGLVNPLTVLRHPVVHGRLGAASCVEASARWPARPGNLVIMCCADPFTRFRLRSLVRWASGRRW